MILQRPEGSSSYCCFTRSIDACHVIDETSAAHLIDAVIVDVLADETGRVVSEGIPGGPPTTGYKIRYLLDEALSDAGIE